MSFKFSMIVSGLLVGSLWSTSLLAAQDVEKTDAAVSTDYSDYNTEKMNKFESLNKKVAKNFLKYRGKTHKLGEDEVLYHEGKAVGILYALEPSGYMITTLDKNEVPVKAYSFNKNFEDLPEAYQELLKARLSEFATLFEANEKANPSFATSAQAIWSKYEAYDATLALQEESVESHIDLPTPPMPPKETETRLYQEGENLISTNWDQSGSYGGGNYNDETPIVNGVRTPVGCNAVAWGQIMNYHEWPIHSYGENIAFIVKKPASTILHQDITEEYHWDNLDIAHFLFYVGVGIRSSYSLADGTSAYPPSARGYLTNHFGYSLNMLYTSYSYGSNLTNFQNEIKEDIDNSLPVFLAFYRPAGNHSVVIDGYDYFSTNEFGIRINMGWSGSGNDFYVLSGGDLVVDLVPQTNPNNDILDGVTKLEILSNIYPCDGSDCASQYTGSSGFSERDTRPALELDAGWSLVALRTDGAVKLKDFVVDSANEVAWVYVNGTWYNSSSYPNYVVTPKMGIWVLSTSNRKFHGQRGEYNDNVKLTTADLSSMNSGEWYLKGTGKQIEDEMYDSFQKDTWVYRNGGWVEDPDFVKAGEGVWFK